MRTDDEDEGSQSRAQNRGEVKGEERQGENDGNDNVGRWTCDDTSEGQDYRANGVEGRLASFLVLFVFSSVAAVCNFKMINTTGMKKLKPS